MVDTAIGTKLGTALGTAAGAHPTGTPVSILGPDDGTTGVSAWWSGDSYTLNGADVSAVANQAKSGSNDMAQGTASKQPLLVTVGGRDGFQFDRATAEALVDTPGTLWNANDYIATWTVFRMDDTIASQDLARLIHLNDVANAGTFGMHHRFRTAVSGIENWLYVVDATGSGPGIRGINIAFSDEASLHLLEMRNDATKVYAVLDGTESSATGTDCRASALVDEAGLGGAADATVTVNATIMESSVWHSTAPLTDAQRDEVRHAISIKYGLGL